MTKEYLDLKMDFMFKQMFGHPSRKRITIAFLNDLLHREGRDRIIDVQFENTEFVKDDPVGKSSRLDVLVFTSTGERINVEIQVINQKDMPERVLYYWVKMFSSSIASGENYEALPPTISISILNYPLFPQETDNYHNVFHIKEDKENFIWSPHLEFHSIDLSNFMVKWKKYRQDMIRKRTPEMPWLMMLSAADYQKKQVYDEIFQELEEYSMNEQEVREALIEWETLSANKENKALYEARLKFLRDQLSNIMGYHREGREEGRMEERKQIILNMTRKGFSVKDISNMTGLGEEEVRRVLEKGV